MFNDQVQTGLSAFFKDMVQKNMIYNDFTRLEIPRTGNFWFDQAIICFYTYLVKAKYDEEEPIDNIQLRVNEGEIVIEGQQEVIEFAIRAAKKKANEACITNTGNHGWFLDEEKNFRIYEKTDFQFHLKPFFKGKTPNTAGAVLMPEVKAKKNDINLSTEEYLKFQKFVEEEGVGKKLTEKGFKDHKPTYQIGSTFDMQDFTSAKTRCQLSGVPSSKIIDVTGMHFPFLTGSSGEMNYASNLKSKPKIGRNLAFLSQFIFPEFYFLRNGDIVHYFLVKANNLSDLFEFQLDLAKEFKEKDSYYHNFNQEIYYCSYSHETLIGFLYSLYRFTKETFKKDRKIGDFGEELANHAQRSVVLFSSNAVGFTNYTEYSQMPVLFGLFNAIEGLDQDSSNLAFKVFFNGLVEPLSKRKDTVRRNDLAQTILQFQSPIGDLERFLGQVGLKNSLSPYYLNKFLETYLIYFQFMNKDQIELCKSIGRAIGLYAKESSDKRVIYNLRNARTRPDFLTALNESQHRIYSENAQKKSDGQKFELVIKNDFLEEFMGQDANWQEWKGLVAIYSMNYFLMKPTDDKKKK
jgi:hypothetical protein